MKSQGTSEPRVLMPRALLGFALGTFHAALLLLVLILVTYWTGGLEDALGESSALVGLLLFAALWGVSWVSAHRVLGAVELEELRFTSDGIAFGALWGGFSGVGFLLLLVVPAITIDLVIHGIGRSGTAPA